MGQGQNKSISASRTSEKIKIDGQMFEKSWGHTEIATDFLELNPTEGRAPRFKTEVRVLFDDNNILYTRLLL